MTASHCHRRVASGLSMVELLVGVALGLLVSTFALSGMVRQAASSRELLLDTRMTHELRASADLLARHLRRSGHWSAAALGVWRPHRPPPAPNPHPPLVTVPDAVHFAYSSPAASGGDAGTEHPFGLQLRDGIVHMAMGDGRWQALSDPSLLRITGLTVQSHAHERVLPGGCGPACAGSDGRTGCTSRLVVHDVELRLRAVSTRDPARQREVAMRVHPPNGSIVRGCAT